MSSREEKKSNKVISHLGEYLPKHIFSKPSSGDAAPVQLQWQSLMSHAIQRRSLKECRNGDNESKYVHFVRRLTDSRMFLCFKASSVDKAPGDKMRLGARKRTDGILLPCNK